MAHLVVEDGQIRPRGGRQVDVREGFGPDDVEAEDALGGDFGLAAAAAKPADEGGADAHGRQFGEGVDGGAAVVTDLHRQLKPR